MNKSKKQKQKQKQTKTKKIRSKKNIGGGRIFTLEGKMLKTNELYEGKEIFQKMTNNENEKKICQILMENPHKNIVKIYEIGNDSIKMELLKTNLENINENTIKEKMNEVKNYLQGLSIMYIDWKLDNIGISEDGELKLFDFNSSGLLEPTKWENSPPEYYSYKRAIQNGIITPIGIDNYVFENTDFTPIDFSNIN
jgi:hypothetical protein